MTCALDLDRPWATEPASVVRFVPEVDDERGMVWLRRAAAFVLVAGLVACAGESGSAPADPTQLPPGVTQPAPGSSGGTTGSSVVGGATPATTDVDGIEPDHVVAPDEAAVPTTALPATTTTRQRLPGFGEVEIEVHRVDGQVVSWCLLLAETPEQTQRGLMEVTDPELGGYDGMLFRFDGERTGSFYMRNTPQPLEIAYVAPDGVVVDIIRMEPCADVDGCPATYAPSAPYQRTIEIPVAAGGAAALGLDQGSSVVDTGALCSA
jgi:uncharacterized membrane protein (UPF0127 family)